MVKKSKKFNYQTDLKKKWKKEKLKKKPVVNSNQIKEFWDPNKSIKTNYMELGLSFDPNVTFDIPKTKKLLNPEIMEIEKAKRLNDNVDMLSQPEIETPAIKKLIKESQMIGEKKYQLNESDCLHCIYMVEKHGEDYKKMAKDYKNYYQETPKQIQKKINLFKKMKEEYGKYLKEKAAGKNFLDELEEKF